MSTVVREVALIGDLTGTEIQRRGGWPIQGVGLELARALRAEIEAEGRRKWWEDRSDARLARFRRLQRLLHLASSRRHARQCARLGFPEDGDRHVLRFFPGELLMSSIYRAFGRGQAPVRAVDAGDDLTNVGLPPKERLLRWAQRTSEAPPRNVLPLDLPAWPASLRTRAERYVADLRAGRCA